MIKLELANMAILAGIKSKKKKKKGKKKKKKKKGKKNRLPGAKYCAELSDYECLVELVQHNIVKKLPTQHLTDFIGEFNFITASRSG